MPLAQTLGLIHEASPGALQGCSCCSGCPAGVCLCLRRGCNTWLQAHWIQPSLELRRYALSRVSQSDTPLAKAPTARQKLYHHPLRALRWDHISPWAKRVLTEVLRAGDRSEQDTGANLATGQRVQNCGNLQLATCQILRQMHHPRSNS